MLAAYCGYGVLDAETAKDMAAWDRGGGFSADASVGIAADDRPALERLLRYCARPCRASERLAQAGDAECLIYPFGKPRMDGGRQITPTPLELLDRLARFIPAPRRHLHRYHGVSVPHAASGAQLALDLLSIFGPVGESRPASVSVQPRHSQQSPCGPMKCPYRAFAFPAALR